LPPGLAFFLVGTPPRYSRGEQNLIAPTPHRRGEGCLFPQISLTGFLAARQSIIQPVQRPKRGVELHSASDTADLHPGRLKSNVRLSEAFRESALIQYEKTIQTAFTEVSNALVAHQRLRESRVQQDCW